MILFRSYMQNLLAYGSQPLSLPAHLPPPTFTTQPPTYIKKKE